MIVLILGIVFAFVVYGAFYFLGKFLCYKIKLLKANANKNNAIISSIILIPLVMTVDKEVLAYGIGYGLSPIIATIILHFIATKFFSKNIRKKDAFFNQDYYFGFLGIIILSYLGLLLPAN